MSTLFIVSTPIGNLEDISARALRTLREVSAILCEDTRKTAKLLAHFHIEKKLLSFHHHSDERKVEAILALLRQGKDLALVTDSGTPGVSDPGNLLIHVIVKSGVPNVSIIPIPGASAVTTLASISGFSTDRFLFLGFLPHKKGKQTMLTTIAESEVSVIFYESPHRILKTLEQLATLLTPDRKLVVGREMTKVFEHYYRGNAQKIIQQITSDSTKGEFAIIVEGKKNSHPRESGDPEK